MFEVKNRLSLMVVHGSHAYGLNTPESDKDYRGICIEPLDYALSVFNNFEQTENHKIESEDEDFVVFGLKKFLKLSTDSNPNALEILFVDDEDIIFKDKFAEKLIKNRDLFLSKKIYLTFGGYAKAQLKRLENHRTWIVNPPTPPPSRTEFGLLEKRPVSEETYKAAKSLINKKVNELLYKDVDEIDRNDRLELIESVIPNLADLLEFSSPKIFETAARSLSFDENIIEYLQKEKQYESKVQHYENYKNWEKTRNKKRYQTEIECLVDTKHASHLIRLLLQAIDALDGKGLIIKRSKEDRDLLLNIKKGVLGKKTYEFVSDLKDKLFLKLEESYQKSTLRRSPDREKIDDIYRDIIMEKNLYPILKIK